MLNSVRPWVHLVGDHIVGQGEAVAIGHLMPLPEGVGIGAGCRPGAQ